MSSNFKEIIIHFSEAICDCKEQDLGWHIKAGENNTLTSNLLVYCKSCNVQIEVPHDKFIAVFAFDKPYGVPRTKKGIKKALPPPVKTLEQIKAQEEIDDIIRKKILN